MSFMQKYSRMIDEETMKKILENPLCNQKCQTLHAGDCNVKFIIQFLLGARSVFKMYLLAHIIPFLLFKLKKFKQNPRKEIGKFIMGLANSLIFAGLSSALVRRVICFLTKYSSYNYTTCRYPASVAGLVILFQSPTRQIEITLFCISKGWESAYAMLKRRFYPVSIPWGNLWINGISIALITFVYLNDSSVIREGYRGALNLILRDI